MTTLNLLCTLPEEILLQIASFLTLLDIFSLKLTCRRLYSLADGDYLWHQLAATGALRVPAYKNPRTLSGTALQAHARRSLRLEANWRKAVPKLQSYPPIMGETIEGSYDEMDLISEGTTLIALRRFNRDRPFFTASIFSLTDAANPYEAARIKILGRLMQHDVSMLPSSSSFALAATILNDDVRSLEVHRLSIPDPSTPSLPRNTFHERSFAIVLPMEQMFYKVAVQNEMVAATIASMHDGVPDMTSPLKIIVANWKYNTSRIIDSGLPELTNLLDLKLFPRHLALVLTRHNTLSVLLTQLEIYFQSGKSTTHVGQPERKLDEVNTHRLDVQLPSRSEIHISTGDPGPYRPSPSINILAMPTSPGVGVHLHVQYVEHPKTQTVEAVQRRSLFQLPHEGFSDLVQLGNDGRRAVWLQQTLESDDTTVNKLDYNAERQKPVSVAVLLPPEPRLPFKPRDCRTLAFDEASGRVCLGLYDGTIYVLDYV